MCLDAWIYYYLHTFYALPTGDWNHLVRLRALSPCVDLQLPPSPGYRFPVRPSARRWFPVLSPFGTDRSLRALEDWWVGKKLRRYLCGSIESGQASEINRLPDSSTQLNKKIQQTMGVTTEEGPGPRSPHSGWDLSEICAKSQNRWVVGGTTISVLLVKNFSTWTHEN